MLSAPNHLKMPTERETQPVKEQPKLVSNYYVLLR